MPGALVPVVAALRVAGRLHHQLSVVGAWVARRDPPSAASAVASHQLVWVTVNVLSAMVRVPVRCMVPVYEPTMNVMAPVPTPFGTGLRVIHGALLVAVQAHNAWVVTVIVWAGALRRG